MIMISILGIKMASSRDGKSVQQWVDDSIKSKPVVVFSKTYCPFCTMAKVILEKKFIIYLSADVFDANELCNINFYSFKGLIETSWNK